MKGVPANQAVILFAENNFWGRTLAAISSSTGQSCESRAAASCLIIGTRGQAVTQIIVMCKAATWPDMQP